MKNFKQPYLLVFFLVLTFSPFFGHSCEDSHSEELKQITEEIKKIISQKKQSNDHAAVIVAIGGCPGVGKSAIANILQAELDKQTISSLVIRLDHYGLSQEHRKQFSNELDPRRIQWSKIHETMTNIKQCKEKITKPTIDQITKVMDNEILVLNNISCVLFEGAYTLCNFIPMNYQDYTDLGIYLETSLENIYDWKWERELKKPKPRTEKAFLLHMKAILDDFAFHVYPSRKNADYIIQIDQSHHYSICDNMTIKQKSSPDFTTIRLESILY